MVSQCFALEQRVVHTVVGILIITTLTANKGKLDCPAVEAVGRAVVVPFHPGYATSKRTVDCCRALGTAIGLVQESGGTEWAVVDQL